MNRHHTSRLAVFRAFAAWAGLYLAALLALTIGAAGALAGEPVVLVFVIDGLQDDALLTAAANGADNLKFLIDNGVRVEEAYSTSPAPRMYLPDGSLPWGTTSSPNVSMHTGTHVFGSRQMDDIFLSARRAGIKSVFAGGAGNYKEFTTADFLYYGSLADTEVVRHGIEHFTKDGTRLIRLHLQEIRRSWTGPACKTDPSSRYIKAICHADSLLGVLIDTFKQAGVWNDVFITVSGDHGMGVTERSDHPPSIRSSWMTCMLFYGPGIRKGGAIPYAETPDMAVMINYFMGQPPLRGHTDPAATVVPKGVTGTFLSAIFEKSPDGVKAAEHPNVIRRYLEANNWSPSDEYVHYHNGMLALIRELAPKQ